MLKKKHVFVNGSLTTAITLPAKPLNSGELRSVRFDENVRLSRKKRPRDPSLADGGSVDSAVI